MEGIKKIVFIACIMAVIISMFDIMYPGKKFASQIKMIFSVIFILALVVPMTNLNINFENLETYTQNVKYSEVNSSVIGVFKNTAENNISNALMEKLIESGYEAKEIKTSINISEDNSISINEVRITCCDPSNELYDLVKSEVGEDTVITIYKIQE